MSTVYGVQYALAFNSVPGQLIPKNKWWGEKRVVRDKYEAAALASGSSIYVCRPPKGAILVGGNIYSDDLANNTTLALGMGVDGSGNIAVVDKFLAATNHGGGSAVKTAVLPVAAIDSLSYEFDGETDIIITTGTGQGTGTIWWVLEFQMPS